MVPMKPGETGSIYVQVFRSGAFQDDADYYNQFDEALEKERTDVEKRIQQFVQGKNVDAKEKELKFIINAGLPREMASDIDIKAREKLERLFPILQQYQCICFKQRPTTMRRMLVFPSKTNYRKYMEDMHKLMKDVNLTKHPELNARVMVRFRGKYIVRVDKEVYDIFAQLIEEQIAKYNVAKLVKFQINRVDLTLFSSGDEAGKLHACVNSIMDILATEDYVLPQALKKYDVYPIVSKSGQKFIEFVNSYKKYQGYVYLRYEAKTQRILINGDKLYKEEIKNYFTEW